jgi:hypothetical protein
MAKQKTGDWKKLHPDTIEYVRDEIDIAEDTDVDRGRELEKDRGDDMELVEEQEVNDKDSVEEHEGEAERQNMDQPQRIVQQVPQPPPPIQPRLTRKMRRLEGVYNPTATAYMNQAWVNSEEEGKEEATVKEPVRNEEPTGELITQNMIDLATLHWVEFYGKVNDMKPKANYDDVDPIKYKDMFNVPTTFDEAWHHPCPWQRMKWWGGIRKENKKMKENDVMKVIKRSEME